MKLVLVNTSGEILSVDLAISDSGGGTAVTDGIVVPERRTLETEGIASSFKIIPFVLWKNVIILLSYYIYLRPIDLVIHLLFRPLEKSLIRQKVLTDTYFSFSFINK